MGPARGVDRRPVLLRLFPGRHRDGQRLQQRHRSLSELVARGSLISFHPKTLRLASAEMPRNRLSKGNDLIEWAMIQLHARDRPAVVPCNDGGAGHRLAGEDSFPLQAHSRLRANFVSETDPNCNPHRRAPHPLRNSFAGGRSAGRGILPRRGTSEGCVDQLSRLIKWKKNRRVMLSLHRHQLLPAVDVRALLLQ
jgi:hypothetical protein